MMMIVVVETVLGVPCPLTVWERDLRMAGGQLEFELNEDGSYKRTPEGLGILKGNKEYEQDFVARLLNRILFFDDVPAGVLEACYYGFGALILVALFLVPPHWPWKKTVLQTKFQSQRFLEGRPLASRHELPPAA